MPTTPDRVRSGLQAVTTAGIAEIAATATAYDTAEDIRSALFVATPLVVAEYAEAAAALALDWYDELRDASDPATAFTPRPLVTVKEAEISNAVAWATQALADFQADVERNMAALLQRIEPVVQRDIAAGFWDSMTGNVQDDPEAVGWRRFTRGAACPFCQMLASRGAVYRANTATFAAHTSCHCVAAPVFRGGETGPEASATQYAASSKRRSEADQARLRDYLKANYGA